MQDIYTPNLVLKVLDGSAAGDVLDFYSENPDFEEYEPARPFNFYTNEYMREILDYEAKVIAQKRGLRLWVFEAASPYKVIGTVSFHNMIMNVYKSCQLGYKFHKDYRHKGYATEGVRCACKVAFEEYDLHRIEAYTMPTNNSSKNLLKRIGFQYEGVARDHALIKREWRDHELYSLLENDIF